MHRTKETNAGTEEGRRKIQQATAWREDLGTALRFAHGEGTNLEGEGRHHKLLPLNAAETGKRSPAGCPCPGPWGQP